MTKLWIYLLTGILVITNAVNVGSYIYYHELNGKSYNITSDERSWIIDDKRSIFISGSIHYPRFDPNDWKSVLQSIKNDGLNMVQIYVFWNIHEPTYNLDGNHRYIYKDRANITYFLDIAKDVGLFVNLRLGPYICAEWMFGGLPVWLLHYNDIKFRYNNDRWKNEVQTFLFEIRDKIEPYLSKNGGPIVMAQIENEYKDTTPNGIEYINWCGQLADELNMNVSWVMCNGLSANNTINVCNANNCYDYAMNHVIEYPEQPLGWTEDEGWFQTYGHPYHPDIYTPKGEDIGPMWPSNNRSPEWLAYSMLIYFVLGGSHHNYYMYIGGNHVDKYAGSSLANYYANSVNYNSDGLPNEPKRSHMNKLHKLLAQYNSVLLGDKRQINNEIIIGGNNKTVAYEYTYNGNGVTFLVNLDEDSKHTVIWNDVSYDLPEQSISILDANGVELFNTAKVNSNGLPTKRVYEVLYAGEELNWEVYVDNITNRMDEPVFNERPFEQIRFTNYTSEYLYYQTNFTVNTAVEGGNLIFDGRCSNGYIIYFGQYGNEKYMGFAHNVELSDTFRNIRH